MEILQDEKMITRIAETFLPVLLTNLIRSGELNIDKIDDSEYRAEIIERGIALVDELQIQMINYSEFIEATESEIKSERFKSAFIMAGTCIEHILNHFYREVLSLKQGLEADEITKAITGLKIPDKIGWFFKLTTSETLSDKMINQVREIISIRNKIVHYQALPDDINFTGGSSHKLELIINGFNFNELVPFLNEFDSTLEGILNKVIPEIGIGNEVFEKYFKKNKTQD
ncbi:hypothetical protein MKY98_17800 [Paenibacillus sp. FSL M8-0228]|uniref:hypothetical protein n=1 Tax=Paenibacillus TaxID=44249 RepID=UPI00083DB29E|nr:MULTISPECIES: hypothetical protein [Paenibacillus]MBO3286219.1 hypothetical protein [Paenibacillus polymyxa]MDY8094462.1 hypothetical protein [Paenibacillus polymyxa]MEE4562921.1 hypothetical protein [Paenibacillus polymyxa]ODB58090.1 hypothetical protein A7311_13160 [Paenibacillus polymyxa]